MPYTITADFLEQALEAAVHRSDVTLSNGAMFMFEPDETKADMFYLVANGTRLPIIAITDGSSVVKLSINGYTYALEALSERDKYFQRLLKETATSVSGVIKVAAPMPGLLKSVKISNGQHVKKGDRLFILEAMKMENDIKAPAEGVVTSINAADGLAVEKGFVLCLIEAGKTDN